MFQLCSLDENAEVCAIVADFGLSRHMLPRSDEFLGTWQWLPPEVIIGQSYNETVDVSVKENLMDDCDDCDDCDECFRFTVLGL